MSLSVSASTFLIDAGTSARPASGNWAHSWCCLSEGKQFIRDLQNEMPSGVLQTTRLLYANFQFTSTASWSWKSKKKFQRKDKKKKEKETLKFFYSSKRNSSGLCMVAGTQWHQTNELTVVLSLSAWELSSKVQNLKKKVEKRYNAARQKGKKEREKISAITAPKQTHQVCA